MLIKIPYSGVNTFAARQALRGKTNVDEYYVNLARVVGAACDKKFISFRPAVVKGHILFTHS